MLPRLAHGYYIAPAPSLAEDGEHEPGENRVHAGDNAHHDQDEYDGNRGVGDQLLASRPDHLPELGPDLPHEDGRARPLRLRRAAGLSRSPGLRATYLSCHVLTCRAGLYPAEAFGWPAHAGVGPAGLEPPTAGFGDRDSGQLSYCPLLSYCLCAAPQACCRCLTEDHQMLKCTLPTAFASNRAVFCPAARCWPRGGPRGVA